jgi:hypothetical protein
MPHAAETLLVRVSGQLVYSTACAERYDFAVGVFPVKVLTRNRMN